MALVVKDRVQEYSTTSGTGTLTLSGAALGFQTFSSSIGNGNTTFYTIYDNIAQVWEVGIGTVGAGTLARTTVLSNSSGTTSPISLAGNNASVFCTYPAEKSVNLDASGNVSPLGTVASGTWQGTTVAVAYGGTGVTASSGANSVVLRDADQNINVNSVTQNLTKTTSAAGTTTLTTASSHFQILTGTTTQTYKLPDATLLPVGSSWVFDNDSTGNLYITDYANGAVDTVAPGGYTTVFLEANGTVAGEWGRFGMLPNEVNWGTNSLDLGGSTVITNGVWHGTPIAYNYGGTGLTTFSAANYALYSTSSSALTAGTLPVAAGGTSATTFTSNGVLYGNGTSALGATAAGTTGQFLVGNTGSAPTWGTLSSAAVTSFKTTLSGLTPSTDTTGAITLAGTLGTSSGGTNLTSFTSGGAVYATSTSALTTGTLPITSGGTGQTTASAAFNALSPITSTGDLIVGNGSNSATRLGIGTNGYVLTSNGTTATWSANASGTTITVTDFTATAGQTTFSVTYTVGLVEVYVNGVKLGQADYTATSGTSIVLATGANVGDLVEVVAFTTLNTITTIASELFSGTGSQTVYTMAYNPANTSSVMIAISGVVQDPSTYTVSTNTLTFSTAPPAGTNNISVRYLGLPSSIGITTFSAGTTGLTPSTATSGAVTLGGTLATANGGTNLTSFTSGGALYATSTSALTTGTLPIASGGTNATTAATALSNLGGVTTGKSIAMSMIFGF